MVTESAGQIGPPHPPWELGLKEGFKMTREEALKRAEKKTDSKINFVTTHSAFLPNINKILKRHGHFLKEEGMDKYIKETLRLRLRRGRTYRTW